MKKNGPYERRIAGKVSIRKMQALSEESSATQSSSPQKQKGSPKKASATGPLKRSSASTEAFIGEDNPIELMASGLSNMSSAVKSNLQRCSAAALSLATTLTPRASTSLGRKASTGRVLGLQMTPPAELPPYDLVPVARKTLTAAFSLSASDCGGEADLLHLKCGRLQPKSRNGEAMLQAWRSPRVAGHTVSARTVL